MFTYEDDVSHAIWIVKWNETKMKLRRIKRLPIIHSLYNLGIWQPYNPKTPLLLFYDTYFWPNNNTLLCKSAFASLYNNSGRGRGRTPCEKRKHVKKNLPSIHKMFLDSSRKKICKKNVSIGNFNYCFNIQFIELRFELSYNKLQSCSYYTHKHRIWQDTIKISWN